MMGGDAGGYSSGRGKHEDGQSTRRDGDGDGDGHEDGHEDGDKWTWT